MSTRYKWLPAGIVLRRILQGATRAEVLAAMKGKVLGKTTLSGQVPSGQPASSKKKKKKGKKGKKKKGK